MTGRSARIRRSVATGAAAALALATAPAALGAAWLPVEQVSQGNYGEDDWLNVAQPLLAPNGQAWVYWENAFAYGPNAPRLSVRPPGAGWYAAAPPPVAEPVGVQPNPNGGAMGITIDAAGVLHAAAASPSEPYGGENGKDWAARAARYTAGGWTLEGPTNCGSPVYSICLDGGHADPGDGLVGVALATADDGRSAAVWSWYRAGGSRLLLARRTSGGSWAPGEEVAVSATERFSSLRAAIDGSGNVAAAWVAETAAGTQLQVRDRRAGAWRTLKPLGGIAGVPAIAAAGDGWLVLAWATPGGSLAFARRSPSGAWTTLPSVAGANGWGADPWVSVDADGSALVVWQDGANVRSAHVPVGGSPVIETVARDAVLQDAVKRSGRASVAVVRGDAVMVVRAAASGWQAPVVVDDRYSSYAPRARITAGPSGDLLLAWVASVGRKNEPPWYATETLLTALYDVTPPAIGTIAVPARITAGEPATFSASATDTLSAVGPLRWDFGAGNAASGGSATTVFDAAGPATVTVRVADAAGNEATASRQVTVLNPAPVLSGVAPASVRSGQGPVSVTVTGSGFVDGSVVRVDGVPVATRMEAPTLLTATIPAASVATTGTLRLTVVNPAPGGGTSAARSLVVEAAPPVVAPPANLVSPAVAGAPAVGATLACDAGRWSGDPEGYAFRWLRDETPVAGAFGTTYVVRADDPGHTLACRVIATNAGGSGTAVSAPVPVPPATPVTSGTPEGPAAAPAGPVAPPVVVADTPAAPLRARVSAPRTVRRGGRITVRVALVPARPGTRVRLEARLGGRWLVVRRAVAGSNPVLLTTRVLRPGTTRFRVRWNDGGVLRTGAPFTVRALPRR